MATLPPEVIYGLNYFVGFNRQESTTMTAIVIAESGGNTDARNPGGTGVGLYQINPKAHGANWENDGRNPIKSAQFAYKLFVGRGRKFTDWEAFTNGAYLKHMPKATQGFQKFQTVSDSVKIESVDLSKMTVEGRKTWESWNDAQKRDYLAAVGIAYTAALAVGLGKVAVDTVVSGAEAVETGATAATSYLTELSQAVNRFFGPFAAIVRYLAAAVEWLSDRNNWLRIAKVIIGGILMAVGVTMLAPPEVKAAAKRVAKATPAGRVTGGKKKR